MRRKILAFLSVIIVSTQLCGCLIYDRSYSHHYHYRYR